MSARLVNPLAFISIAMVVSLGCSEPTDWSARPLVPQEGVVEDAKFRWTVPEGMKKDEMGAGFALRGEGDKQPSPRFQVTLERPFPPNITSAVKAAKLADAVVSRQDEVPGGFIVSGHSQKKDQILVNVWREHEGVALRCQAAYASSKGIPSFDKALAMLEKVCLSVGVAE
jgi:hypothetical protein